MKTTKGRKATPKSQDPTFSPAASTFEAALAKVGEVVYTTVFAAGSQALLDIEKAALAGKSRRKPGSARKPSATPKTPTKPVATAKAKLAPGAKRTPEAIAEIGSKVLAFVTAHPWSTVEKIAAGTGLTTREIKGPLAKLKGLDPARTPAALRWTGSKRATVYALASELTDMEKFAATPIRELVKPADEVPGSSTEVTYASDAAVAAEPDVTEPEEPAIGDESAEAAE